MLKLGESFDLKIYILAETVCDSIARYKTNVMLFKQQVNGKTCCELANRG